MENHDAFVFLNSKSSIREATELFIEQYNIDENEYETIRNKFRKIKSEQVSFRKRCNLETWNKMIFYNLPSICPQMKRLCQENHIIEIDLSNEFKKPLSDLTLKSLRTRLAPLLNIIEIMANKEKVDKKSIVTYALQLISNEEHDKKIPIVCKEIISSGTFANALHQMPLNKSLFLIDLLQIGKRKYNDLRRLCKIENFIFPSYNLVAEFRSNIVSLNELKYISNISNETIGIGISYKDLLQHTLFRLFETVINDNFTFPLTLKISDGLDGSGSHKIYNQQNENICLSTKNYILFGFKLLSLRDVNGNIIWINDVPNSPFGLRPVALICQKENETNVKFIMDKVINPEVLLIEKEGLTLPNGQVLVEIMRSMLDGKMSSILTGAGGANCQLCTAEFKDLKDLDLIHSGYPMNRSISSSKKIFETVDPEEFLALPSKERFGITHQPISNIDIISASPLHSYTCCFRWFMLVIYHLQSGTFKWSPTSKYIQQSMKFTREFIEEKTGMRIDQPSSDGGTTSTGNIARSCFMNKKNFGEFIATLIPIVYRQPINEILNNLSAILRIFNSSHQIDTDKLDNLCKYTYTLIVTTLPWVNITPSLHKLLAHCVELIKTCNNGYGLKEYSEEALEACNKLVRKYRENLSRKCSFNLNIKDIFVRLMSESDPVLINFRKVPKCKFCGAINHYCNVNCTNKNEPTLEQDILVSSLIIDNLV